MSSIEPVDRSLDPADQPARRDAPARPAEPHTPEAPPDSVQAHLMTATALLRANEVDAAVRALEAVVARAPSQPMARYQLAVANARAGRHERALMTLGEAVELGFRQPRMLETEPAFAPYRASSAYRTTLELARRNQHPCAGDADHRAFDFFAGRWRVTTADGIVAGTNHVEVILGGAGLVERWTSVNGYQGTSLNRLDPATGTWRQTWVDDQGDVIEFVDGHAGDGAMRFVAHGEGVERRLTFFDEGSDALRQLAEVSQDGGTTWSVEYDLRYRRLADADGDVAGAAAGADGAARPGA
jgi:hypothetical protein